MQTENLLPAGRRDWDEFLLQEAGRVCFNEWAARTGAQRL